MSGILLKNFSGGIEPRSESRDYQYDRERPEPWRYQVFVRIIAPDALHSRQNWGYGSRVDTIDADILRRMQTNGCRLVMYGVELDNREILKSINKKVDPRGGARVIRIFLGI
ncbi:MAG: hypothetical protein KKD99_07645 [Proteobacteria bacterium]|nr:hypothetical protein [Pseudomonadota bacterium]